MVPSKQRGGTVLVLAVIAHALIVSISAQYHGSGLKCLAFTPLAFPLQTRHPSSPAYSTRLQSQSECCWPRRCTLRPPPVRYAAITVEQSAEKRSINLVSLALSRLQEQPWERHVGGGGNLESLRASKSVWRRRAFIANSGRENRRYPKERRGEADKDEVAIGDTSGDGRSVFAMNDGDNDTIGYTRGGAYLSSGGTEGEGQQRRLKPEAAATEKSASAVMWSKTVISKWRRGSERFRVLLAGREDLDEAGALCIKVFFGQSNSPWKSAQLRQLTGEQLQDLISRCNRNESVMFKAVDTRCDDAMVGFVEVSETAGLKYGMGSGVSLSDTRPVVSNLAVDPRVRRFGIGTALMDACEDIVKNWNFDEIILQVEEDNQAGLAFYSGMGFKTLFVDRAARRYDTSGFLLQNVRTSKATMRKVLTTTEVKTKADPKSTFGDQLAQLLGFLVKPFVAQPPPSTNCPAGSASVKDLFGPSTSGGLSTSGGGRASSPTPGSPTPGSKIGKESALEVPPVSLYRTRR